MYIFLFISRDMPEGHLQVFNKRIYEALLKVDLGTYIGRL